VVTDKTGFRRDFGNLGREKKPWPGGRNGAVAAGPGQADLLSVFICSTDVAAG
jgi:hypothetical protein